MTELWAMGLVVLASMFGSLGPIFFKKGSKMPITQFYKNIDLLLGVFMYGISTIIFIPALKGGELSVLYPLVALVYIWTSLLSVKYLHEKMNVYKWSGILIIMIGVGLIGLGS